MNRRQLLVLPSLALLNCSASKDAEKIGKESGGDEKMAPGARPADANYPKLSHAQSLTEGHSLAMYILCMHPQNYKDLRDAVQDASKPRPTAFSGIRDDVYKSLSTVLIKRDAFPGIDPGQRIQQFTDVFRKISQTALQASGDPYNGDPNGCVSQETMENLLNTGLVKAT